MQDSITPLHYHAVTAVTILLVINIDEAVIPYEAQRHWNRPLWQSFQHVDDTACHHKPTDSLTTNIFLCLTW